jgi:small conductance mechanosensitive channel
MLTLAADWPLIARFGFAFLVALIAFPLASLAAGAVRRAARGSANMAHMDTTVVTFAAELARVVFLIGAIILVLTLAGVEPNSVAAVIGAATLAIGLALQGTLANVAAGLLIVIFRPYRIGDSVELAAKRGLVRLISLFTTEIETFNGLAVIIPNAHIMSQPMINYSRNPRRRIDVDILLHWDTDTAVACQLLKDLYENDPRLTPEDRVDVVVKALVDKGPVLSFRLTIGQKHADAMALELPGKLHRALRAANISVPA